MAPCVSGGKKPPTGPDATVWFTPSKFLPRMRGSPTSNDAADSLVGAGRSAGLILEKAAVASFVRASPASFLSASKVGWSIVGRNGISTGGAVSSLALTSSLSVVTRTAGGSSRYAAGPTWANPAGIWAAPDKGSSRRYSKPRRASALAGTMRRNVLRLRGIVIPEGRPKRVFDREKAQTMLQSMSVREVARQRNFQ